MVDDGDGYLSCTDIEMFCLSSQMILFSCSLLEGLCCSTFCFKIHQSCFQCFSMQGCKNSKWCVTSFVEVSHCIFCKWKSSYISNAAATVFRLMFSSCTLSQLYEVPQSGFSIVQAIPPCVEPCCIRHNPLRQI